MQQPVRRYEYSNYCCCSSCCYPPQQQPPPQHNKLQAAKQFAHSISLDRADKAGAEGKHVASSMGSPAFASLCNDPAVPLILMLPRYLRRKTAARRNNTVSCVLLFLISYSSEPDSDCLPAHQAARTESKSLRRLAFLL